MRPCNFLFLTALVFTVSMLPAQELQRGPESNSTTHVAGIQLLPIPGLPLSGMSTIEWKRPQPDGSTMLVHETSFVARDSQGRLYHEMHGFVPMDVDPMSRLNEIEIFDTVAHTKTICKIQTQHCEVTGYYPQKHFKMPAEGWNKDHSSFLERVGLGTQQMQGLDVTGVRETVTVNAGVNGNSKPAVTTREFWYNAVLETNLMVTRNDPVKGLQVVRLSELNLEEPERGFFMVPEGFTVEDKRGESAAPGTQSSQVPAAAASASDATAKRPEYNGRDAPTPAIPADEQQ